MMQPDKPWWRTKPLTPDEADLMWALARAHQASAFRENASTVAVANAAHASLDVGKAIAAGIMTLGGRHAPLEQTIQLLSVPASLLEDQVIRILADGEKVPGWGGSFQKDKPDPLWDAVASRLAAQVPDKGVVEKISLVTRLLHAQGIIIHPNPSAYTAAASILLDLPPKLAVYLFIAARLPAWAEIALRQISPLSAD
jgi:citrate synthase